MKTIQYINEDTIIIPWAYNEGDIVRETPTGPIVFNESYLQDYVFSSESYKYMKQNDILYVPVHDPEDKELYTINLANVICKVIDVTMQGCTAQLLNPKRILIDFIKESDSFNSFNIYIASCFIGDPNKPETYSWGKFELHIDSIK